MSELKMEIEFVQLANLKGEGSWVPVVNSTLIHSAIDPFKEAKTFIDQEWERLKDNNSLIVFGLGGGFHIAELLKCQVPFVSLV